MSRPQDEIVFEDLHGVEETDPVTVNLDADLNDAGIERAPDDESVDVDAKDDDGVELDDLHSDYSSEQQDDEDEPASKANEDNDYSRTLRKRIKRATDSEPKAKKEAAYWREQTGGDVEAPTLELDAQLALQHHRHLLELGALTRLEPSFR